MKFLIEMGWSTQKIRAIALLIISLSAPVANAQPVAQKSEFATVEYQNYGKYFERITYIGKRKDYFIVHTYLKDSTLYRVDNYRFVDRGNLLSFLAVRHGPTKILYSDGRPYLTCDYNMNVLNGAFIVYYADGAIKRRELYRSGNLKKSVCYDPDGAEKACEAFYQQPKFMGNAKELNNYFVKSLLPIIDGSLVRNVSIKLLINEIGQIIDVGVNTGGNNPVVVAAVRKVVLDMPRWRENELNWKPATMDGVPIPESLFIHAYRDKYDLRVRLP